jgi:chromosome segregation ATPase
MFFLNGFWKEESLNGEPAELIYQIVKTFTELDPKGAEGNELDEFNSHRLLEKYNETLSVIKMREALREIDVDANGQMAALEYLIWRYKKSVEACATSPQGDNQAKIEACQRKIDEVQSALADVQAKAEVNRQKMEAQKAAIAATEAAIRELEAKEAELAAAEAESKAAVAELKAQEDAYAAKIAELEAKSQTGGVVSRNKAGSLLSFKDPSKPVLFCFPVFFPFSSSSLLTRLLRS